MKKKICAFLSVIVLALIALAGIAIKPVTVQAETAPLTYESFAMEDGAAVRLGSDGNGLRFSAEISETEYASLKGAGAKFGFLIVAKDLLKDVQLTPQTVFGTNPAFYFTNETGAVSGKKAMLHLSDLMASNRDKDEKLELYGAIVNILTDNFTRSFVGVAYVALPSGTDAQTGETTYTYHFAPYYGGDMANNTRCMYYVAQRSIEQNEYVDNLKNLYITPFAQTARYQNYLYAFNVEHRYVVHDENDGHKTIYTTTTRQYGKLNAEATAQPIEKPTGTGVAEMEGNFIYDVDNSLETRTKLVYAAGMQTMVLYYELASDLNEHHKAATLAELLEHFLDVDNAEANFGVDVTGDAATGWVASPVYKKDEAGNAILDENGEQIVIGINLHTEQTKRNQLLLSKHFFDELRAYGVESVTFTVRSADKAPSYTLHQEESDALIEYVYDGITGDKLSNTSNKPIKVDTVKLYLKDITPQGGVLVEMDNSMSNNLGDYMFENISFGFPTVSVE